MAAITIQLTDDQLQRLQQAASRDNGTPEALAMEAIDQLLRRHSTSSLADVLADYVGAVDGPPTDSSRIGEAVGEYLADKHLNGRL